MWKQGQLVTICNKVYRVTVRKDISSRVSGCCFCRYRDEGSKAQRCITCIGKKCMGIMPHAGFLRPIVSKQST